MTGGLREVDRERCGASRALAAPLSDEVGLGLLDAARVLDRACLLPVRLDSAALRASARGGRCRRSFRGLVRVPARRDGGGGEFAGRLLGVAESERDGLVLEFVRGHVAEVLGHDSGEAVDPERPFKELGFDSLGAIELRNRLARAAGVSLPSTLVFDYPTVRAVAGFLGERVEGVGRGVGSGAGCGGGWSCVGAL